MFSAREATESGGSDADLSCGYGTILLVEDDEMVRRMARQILEISGYTVVEADNGARALQFCEEHDTHIDLVLTDVVMPQMGGRELVKRLARLLPEAKVLYMSGYTDDTIAPQGSLDQIAHFLQKPFAPDALLSKVREVLETTD